MFSGSVVNLEIVRIGWLRIAAAVFVCLCILAPSARAQDENRRILRVAYEEFPPYSFTGVSGDAQGYSIDLMHKLAEAAGYGLQFVATSNPGEVLDLLVRGEVDATTLLAVTPERQQLGNYTLPMGRFRTNAFVRRDATATSPTDLSAQRIGVVAGSFAVRAAAEIPFAEVIEIDSQNALAMSLLSGSVDAIASSEETFLAQMRKAGLENRVRSLSPSLLESPRGFLISPNLPDVLDDMNAVIESQITPQSLELLHHHWFGQDRSLLQQAEFQLGAKISAVAAILLVVCGLITWRAHVRKVKSFADYGENKLLINALNGIDLAIVIFDQNMKAVHWNDGFIRNFPKMLPDMRRGVTLPEAITRSYLNGSQEAKDKAEAMLLAEEVVQNIKAGNEVVRLTKLSDGRTFEAHDFAIGNGMYASVRTNVTKLQQQSIEIQNQHHLLESANEKLRSFSSIAAHDLRAPVTQQRTLLEFLREDLEDGGIDLPQDARENLSYMSTTMDRMSELIEDLLTYARTESQADDVQIIAPTDRLAAVVDLVAVPSGFDVIIDDNLPLVEVSPVGFDTVMRNLVSNALKHHDGDKGTVTITGRCIASSVQFDVQDDGPGIPAEFLELIFEPFQRLGPKDANAGSGLGLSFVLRTVQGWDGFVEVISPEGGRGSTFRITIPQGSVTMPNFDSDRTLRLVL